jgi:ribosomal protein L24
MSDIKLGDKVRVLNGKYKGAVMTVEKIEASSSGSVWLYLTMGNVVIFRTTKQVELARE